MPDNLADQLRSAAERVEEHGRGNPLSRGGEVFPVVRLSADDARAVADEIDLYRRMLGATIEIMRLAGDEDEFTGITAAACRELAGKLRYVLDHRRSPPPNPT